MRTELGKSISIPCRAPPSRDRVPLPPGHDQLQRADQFLAGAIKAPPSPTVGRRLDSPFGSYARKFGATSPPTRHRQLTSPPASFGAMTGCVLTPTKTIPHGSGHPPRALIQFVMILSCQLRPEALMISLHFNGMPDFTLEFCCMPKVAGDDGRVAP